MARGKGSRMSRKMFKKRTVKKLGFNLAKNKRYTFERASSEASPERVVDAAQDQEAGEYLRDLKHQMQTEHPDMFPPVRLLKKRLKKTYKPYKKPLHVRNRTSQSYVNNDGLVNLFKKRAQKIGSRENPEVVASSSPGGWENWQTVTGDTLADAKSKMLRFLAGFEYRHVRRGDSNVWDVQRRAQ